MSVRSSGPLLSSKAAVGGWLGHSERAALLAVAHAVA